MLMLLYAGMDIMAALVAMTLLLAILTDWKAADKPIKEFIINLILYLIGIGSCIATYFVDLETELFLTYITLIVGSLMSAGYMYYSVFTVNLKKEIVSIWYARAVLILNLLSCIIVTISYFKGTLYGDYEGYYEPEFYAHFAFYVEVFSTLVTLYVITRCFKEIGARSFFVLAVLIVLPIFSTLVETIFPDVFVSYNMIVISFLMQYAFIQSKRLRENRLREELMQEILLVDELTGLKNRRAYSEFTDLVSCMPGTVAVGFFDLNGLKQVNDQHGHVAGDRHIIQFAEILKKNVKHGEAFRISGDEFVIIYCGEDKRKNFDLEIELIKSDIKIHNEIASVGISFGDGKKLFPVINEAEKRMYENKRAYHKTLQTT